mmetsp:Transcript_6921/g.14186  ORF Transcript_6921/g.14186 Transcript_6921/m.14186 type:complete len:384 (-) Transcript_6921:78-1229(-)
MSKKRDRWSSDEDDDTDDSPSNKIFTDCLKQPLQPSILSIEPQSDKTTRNPPPGLRFHNPLLHGCRSVYDSYERLSHLDEGTYGVVWKARDNSTNEIVAIKQIKFDSEMTTEGFPISALREIGVLLSLSHECIVTVREMVVGSTADKVFMVMECMDMDLQAAMKKGPGAAAPFAQSEVKNMMHQILSAIAHVHEKWFIHRDMKTSNILVHKTGRIALCDFGLARKYESPARKMTQMVVTLWYRAPELLFGEAAYGPEIDMWSIGCIFGELLIKDAIMKGTGELDQIQKIFALRGTPSEESWPAFYSLPSSGTFKWKGRDGSELGRKFQVNSFSATGQTYLDSNGFDLLTQLLTLNPQNRISAADALNHTYFSEGVKMQVPEFF